MALDDATLPNVIADVGDTLRQLLRDQISELNPEGRVIFTSPADVDAVTEPRLGLYLYQLLETPQMRNDPPVLDDDSGTRRYQTVDLYYLLTPYTQQLEDGHRLLGRVMRVLFDHGILRGSILQGSLSDIGQEIRILLHPLDLEEINKLWSVFPNKAYRLSIAYQVTPVKIIGALTGAGDRVITRELDYTHLKNKI